MFRTARAELFLVVPSCSVQTFPPWHWLLLTKHARNLTVSALNVRLEVKVLSSAHVRASSCGASQVTFLLTSGKS